MATATAVVGAGAGVAKFFEGRAMQKRAENFIENFEWQDLTNPFEDVQVSTMGADLRREEMARTTASAMENIRGGGTRAIVGAMDKIQQNNNLVNKEIASELDAQKAQIDMAVAQQNVNNQNTVEGRQANELQGYGQMMNVGMGMKYGGLTNIANAMGTGGQSIDFGGFTPQVSNANAGMTSAGLSSIPSSLPVANLPNFYTG